MKPRLPKWSRAKPRFTAKPSGGAALTNIAKKGAVRIGKQSLVRIARAKTFSTG
jgi:hypothetical protein